MDQSSSNVLKVIFGVHLTLISLGSQGYWNPDSYMLYNLIFLLTILWSIHNKDNAEPLQYAIGVNLLAAFLDVITFVGYFPTGRGSGEKFSAAMAIINLLVRPVSLVFMCRMCNQRMGLDTDNFANIFTGNNIAASSSRNTYEDIGN